MNFIHTIISKNKRTVKFALLMLFALVFVWDLAERYYYRAELDFKLKWLDIEYLILICLILINPKGIRILVSAVFVFLTAVSTYSMMFEHLAVYPRTLILRKIFLLTTIDSSIVYLIHVIIYLSFIIMILYVRKPPIVNDLIDQ